MPQDRLASFEYTGNGALLSESREISSSSTSASNHRASFLARLHELALSSVR